MNIDKIIAELELRHLIESLLELDLKNKHGLTYNHGISYASDQIVKDWSDKNIERFMELLDCLGINDPSFCSIPRWAKLTNNWFKFMSFATAVREMPVDTVYCYKLENGMTMLSELKLDKNEEFTILNQFDGTVSAFSDAFFKQLYIAINDNLMLNRPKVLEQNPFMKKIQSMFSNY